MYTQILKAYNKRQAGEPDGGGMEAVKEAVVYSALGLGTATGLFLLARTVVRKLRAASAQKNSLDEGEPATFAKQLKMAFDNDNYFGWGTNEEMVFSVFRALPSKSLYSKVQREYAKLYNRSLNADLEDELSSDEYNEVIRILSTKS